MEVLIDGVRYPKWRKWMIGIRKPCSTVFLMRTRVHFREGGRIRLCLTKRLSDMATKAPNFEKGDQARYTAVFLKNTAQYTDRDGTHGWAKVTAVTEFGNPNRHLVHLRWPNGIERKVLSVNLQRKGSPLRVCDVDP